MASWLLCVLALHSLLRQPSAAFPGGATMFSRQIGTFPGGNWHFAGFWWGFPLANGVLPSNIAILRRKTAFSASERRFPPANAVFRQRTSFSASERRFPPANVVFRRRTAFSVGERRFYVGLLRFTTVNREFTTEPSRFQTMNPETSMELFHSPPADDISRRKTVFLRRTSPVYAGETEIFRRTFPFSGEEREICAPIYGGIV